MIDLYHKSLLGRHQGETAFVVGAGTSLYGLDLDPIHKHVVISVNSSILLMPWDQGEPDRRFWISNDALCRMWSWWPLVLNAKATKIVRNSWSKYFPELQHKGFLQFEPRRTEEGVVEDDDLGLCYCSSVPSGVDLAIKMGCKQIFLLGVDQYMNGSKSHYFQYWPLSKQPRRTDRGMATYAQQKWTFGYNDKAYPALLGHANRLGVKIWNCNPKSKVESFEKIDYSDALLKM